jgi:hypothetical protein
MIPAGTKIKAYRMHFATVARDIDTSPLCFAFCSADFVNWNGEPFKSGEVIPLGLKWAIEALVEADRAK